MEIEKGKTAKYLREKLGGIPEQAKANLKEFNGIKKLMLEALKEQDLTVKQMSEKNKYAHRSGYVLFDVTSKIWFCSNR